MLLNIVRAAFVLAIFTARIGNTQEFSFLVGTYEVGFLPMQIGGDRLACALLFKAITLDQPSRQRKPLVVGGNIIFGSNRYLAVCLAM